MKEGMHAFLDPIHLHSRPVLLRWFWDCSFLVVPNAHFILHLYSAAECQVFSRSVSSTACHEISAGHLLAQFKVQHANLVRWYLKSMACPSHQTTVGTGMCCKEILFSTTTFSNNTDIKSEYLNALSYSTNANPGPSPFFLRQTTSNSKLYTFICVNMTTNYTYLFFSPIPAFWENLFNMMTALLDDGR